MTDALKPCPFCGGQKLVVQQYGIERPDQEPSDGDFAVICDECGATGEEIAPRSAAIAAWNRRAPQPSPATDALADELERLKTLIASFPAHAQDMGPDNTVFADHIPMDGAEIGECPRPIERLAEAILSALRQREHQEEQS